MVALAFAVFAGTVLLVLVRPWGLHEAWWATMGAIVSLATGLVPAKDVVRVLAISHEALLFLLALLVLSLLADRSGIFDWSATAATRLARGDGRALFRNIFVLGAIMTAALSLDTTALLLTPLVLVFTKRLGMPSRPFVILCALVANTASLLLPVSNLTNLVYVSSFHWRFGAYAARMALPQVAALLATYGLAWRTLATDVPRRFDDGRLGDPWDTVSDPWFFRVVAVALALVLVGYFVAPAFGVPAYASTLGIAAAALAGALRAGRVRAAELAALSWGVFPFAVGLFVVVQSFDHVGVTARLARALASVPAGGATRTLAVTGSAALASNVMNNLPAALLARSVLDAARAPPSDAYAALVGIDVGPNLAVFASLATMLVLGVARDRGEPVAARDLLRASVRITPLALAGAALVLAVETWWFG